MQLDKDPCCLCEFFYLKRERSHIPFIFSSSTLDDRHAFVRKVGDIQPDTICSVFFNYPWQVRMHMAGKLLKSRCVKCQYYTTSLAFLLLSPDTNTLFAAMKSSFCFTRQSRSLLHTNYLGTELKLK